MDAARHLSHNRYSDHGMTAVTLAAILMAIGVIMVLSAGAELEETVVAWSGGAMPALRQLAAGLVGFATMIGLMLLPCRVYRWRTGSATQLALVVALLSCVLLLSVYVPGIGIGRNGARRWVDLGYFSLQPSEFAKPGMILLLAAWFSRPGCDPGRFFRSLVPAVCALVILIGLVGCEDFGTAALLTVVAGAMLVAAGCRLRHLVLLSLPAIGGLAFLVVSRPYRVRRLLNFADIWADPQGAGYHPVQSLCTIASGGWFGQGLGAGIQKYGYLPQARSDFIFSVICEEVGVLGGIVVIGLLAGLVWQGRRAMVACPDRLGQLLACGITMLIGAQAALNIAVVTVVVPTKGIALPFVSAGGTGVFVFCACVGILASVSRSTRVSSPPP